MKRYILVGFHPKHGTTIRRTYDDVIDAMVRLDNLTESGYTAAVVDTLKEGAAKQPAPAVNCPYMLHSNGTRTGQRKWDYIDNAQTEFGAIDLAKDYISSWSHSHKGIVVYKAIKLVQRQQSPVEVTDL